MYKIIICAAVILTLSACQAPFNERVIKAQDEIAVSFRKIGYTPLDVISVRNVPQKMQDKKWNERQVLFRDRCDREWSNLHQFFAHDANYDFDYYLTVGESVTDVESIRWFEFKLDQYYTICRVAFVRKGRHGLIPRKERNMELQDNVIKVDGQL